MMRDQVIDAFIAALCLEGGVSLQQIDRALMRVESVKLGEDFCGGFDDIREFAQAAGARFRAIR